MTHPSQKRRISHEIRMEFSRIPFSTTEFARIPNGKRMFSGSPYEHHNPETVR